MVGRWAPATRRPIKWVSFGSAVTVVGWLVASAVYGLWVTQISSVGSAFGSLAAVFVFIVFTYLSCVVYLAGAVVDLLFEGLGHAGTGSENFGWYPISSSEKWQAA